MKKNIIALITLVICMSSCVFAQTNHEEILPPDKSDNTQTEKIFEEVEQMPQFIGGEQAFFKYLGEHINYPVDAKKNGITGTVYVYFVIDKKGNVRNAEVKRGVRGGEDLDAEALRVINEMPAWEPGYQKGKPASVQYTIPIKFKLNNPSEKEKKK